MKFRSSLPYIVAMLLLASVFGGASPTLANTTITVTSTDDEPDYNFGVGTCSSLQNDTKCTLRAAIQTANQTAGADTIIVPAGTYTLSILAPSALPGVVNAQNIANGDLDILESLTIQGNSAGDTIIAGGAGFNDRIFDIAAPAVGGSNVVTISNVTITGGSLTGDSGAGISNDATLTLSNVVVTGNQAVVDNTSGTPRGGDGGGARNRGTLNVNATTFSGNQAGDDAGALYSTSNLNVVNSSFTNNTAGGVGGAIDNTGLARISGTTFDTNSTTGSGGAIANTGNLTLEQSLVVNSQATVDGGGVYNSGGTLTISNATLTSNTSTRNGGGIATVTPSGGAAPQTILTNVTLAYNNSVGTGENVRIAAGNLYLRNTLLDINAGSAGRNCSIDVVAATVTSAGNNLEGVNFSGVPTNSSCGLVAGIDRIGQEAGLATLADNGGPTRTIALLANSQAIDTASNCPVVDQRGYNRPADGNGDGTFACDIGAFEASAVLRPTHVLIPLVIKN